MAIDWQLNPPESVSVEVFDWSHDSNGNPTANYLLMWGNGKTGADWRGGHYRSPRRQSVGYRDKTTESAMWKLGELFPGTCWQIGPDGITGSRAGGSATFQAVRDWEAESKLPVPVLFRTDRAGPFRGDVTAVFPTLPGSPGLATCYAHIGQHSSCSRQWYVGTRPATEAEAAPLKAELERIGYALHVVQRWTAGHDAIRNAAERRPIRESV